MQRITAKLTGHEETQRQIDKFDRKIRTRVVKKAVRAGGREGVKATRKAVRTSEVGGGLAKAINQRVRQYRGAAVSVIGAKNVKNAKTGTNYLKIAHLVDRGTRPHTIPRGAIDGIPRQNIQHPGARAKPFMEPGFHAAQKPASERFITTLVNESTSEAAEGDES